MCGWFRLSEGKREREGEGEEEGEEREAQVSTTFYGKEEEL